MENYIVIISPGIRILVTFQSISVSPASYAFAS